MNKLLTTTAMACLAVLVTAPAMAIPLTGTFSVVAYQGTNPNPGVSTDPTQQALPSAIPAILAHSTYTSPNFTYTGPIAFGVQTPPINLTLFFASAGGTTSTALGGGPLSAGGYTDATLMKFSFTTSGPISGTITHDDGVSLYAAGDTAMDLLPVSSSAPTVAVGTNFSLAGGSYDLYFSEVNDAPVDLTFDVINGRATVSATVPEPMSMALLGSGLLGLGLARRKARRT